MRVRAIHTACACDMVPDFGVAPWAGLTAWKIKPFNMSIAKWKSKIPGQLKPVTGHLDSKCNPGLKSQKINAATTNQIQSNSGKSLKAEPTTDSTNWRDPPSTRINCNFWIRVCQSIQLNAPPANELKASGFWTLQNCISKMAPTPQFHWNCLYNILDITLIIVGATITITNIFAIKLYM